MLERDLNSLPRSRYGSIMLVMFERSRLVRLSLRYRSIMLVMFERSRRLRPASRDRWIMSTN